MTRRSDEADRQLRGTFPVLDCDTVEVWTTNHYVYACGYKLKVTEMNGQYSAESPDLPAFRAHGDSMEQVREYAERMIPLVLVDRDERLSCFASGGRLVDLARLTGGVDSPWLSTTNWRVARDDCLDFPFFPKPVSGVSS